MRRISEINGFKWTKVNKGIFLAVVCQISWNINLDLGRGVFQFPHSANQVTIISFSFHWLSLSTNNLIMKGLTLSMGCH